MNSSFPRFGCNSPLLALLGIPSLKREGKGKVLPPLSFKRGAGGELVSFFFVFTLFFIFTSKSYAQPQPEPAIILSGVSRNDIVAVEMLDKNKPAVDQVDFAGANLLTLDFKNAKTATAKIEGSFDLWLLSGVYADAFNRGDSSSALSILQSSSSAFLLDIRKLYGSLFLPFADFSVGRQIISFGQGLVFSPIDVFSSVNILDLSLRRSGSDVARVRVPFGDLAGIDAIAKLTSREDGTAAAVKAYSHIGSFDLAGIGIYQSAQSAQNEVITGVTFKGDLVAGVYGELVEHWKQGGDRAFVGMLGADYSIENNWYFTAEYLYNEQPEQRTAPASFSIVQTSIPLLDHHYGFVSARYKINDIMNISASAIADITAKSGIVTVQYFYNILQNANTILYIQLYPASQTGLLPQPTGELTYGLRVEVAF
jgi:hypothetical protein